MCANNDSGGGIAFKNKDSVAADPVVPTLCVNNTFDGSIMFNNKDVDDSPQHSVSDEGEISEFSNEAIDSDDMIAPKMGLSTQDASELISEVLTDMNQECHAAASLENDIEVDAKGLVIGVTSMQSQLRRSLPPHALMQCNVKRIKSLFGKASFEVRLARTGQMLVTIDSAGWIQSCQVGDECPTLLGRVERKKGLPRKMECMSFEFEEPGKQRMSIDFEARSVQEAVRPMVLEVKLPTPDVDAPDEKAYIDGEDVINKKITESASRSKMTTLRTVDAIQANGRSSLNFAGRVKLSSVKNMQMRVEGAKEIALQMGRNTKDGFICDIRHPLSAAQGIAIFIGVFMNGGKA